MEDKVSSSAEISKTQESITVPNDKTLTTTILSNGDKTIVFFLTAPHEQPDRGDTDYVQTLISSLNERANHNNMTFNYITGNNTFNSNRLYNIDELYTNNEYKIGSSLVRTQAVSNIVNYIKSFVGYKYKFLHHQLRAPETGCMIHPVEISNLKEIVHAYIITCHEWMHYAGTPGSRQNQVQQLSYIKEANHTIFLNQADRDDAIKASQSGHLTSITEEQCEQFDYLPAKSSVSNITATLPTKIVFNVEEFLKRPPNVLIFGLMRQNKGFEIGLKIAKLISNLDSNHTLKSAKVIFAGKPNDKDLVRKLIFGKYNSKEFEDEFLIEYEFRRRIIALEKFNNFKKEKIKIFVFELFDSQDANFKEEIESIIKDSKLLSISKNIIDFLIRGNIYEKSLIQLYKSKLDNQIKIINNKNYNPSTIQKEIEEICFIQQYEISSNKWKKTGLLIDFYFNITKENLDILAQQSKYCIKIEDKGFANNSSSIINALNRGLIVFTNDGTLTSQDFKENGRYQNSLILLTENNFDYHKIFELINQRELDSQQYSNKITLEALKNTNESLFSVKKVVHDHTTVYTKLINEQKNRDLRIHNL